MEFVRKLACQVGDFCTNRGIICLPLNVARSGMLYPIKAEPLYN